MLLLGHRLRAHFVLRVGHGGGGAKVREDDRRADGKFVARVFFFEGPLTG